MANTFIFDDDNQPNAGGPMSDQGGDQPEEGEGGNRNAFTIIAIGIGGFILLSLICMVVYLVLIMPSQKASQATQQANSAATQTQSASVQLATQQAALFTPTVSATPFVTDTATTTPVVVFATDTPGGDATNDPATATVQALQTQLASAQLTVTFQPSPTGGTPTKTQLAKTGFADEVGLPGLFVAALVLLGVILLARRLRAVPER